MQISIDNIMLYGSSASAMVAAWFGVKYGLDRVKEKMSETQRQVEALWKWKDEHERDASGQREKLSQEIYSIKGSLLVYGEQFKQIIQILENIKEQIAELEKK